VVVGIGASVGTLCAGDFVYNPFCGDIEMKRIVLWLIVFNLTIYSLISHDLRPMALALAFSFGYVALGWVKRRNRW